MDGDFLTIEETAKTLGVSMRHARRLAESGAVTRVARGLVDRGSVAHYLQSQRQGRTRSWAEHTAWGAVAFLSGQSAGWLGTSQASRLRSTLRGVREVDDLLARTRDRAKVHTFEAHRAALPRLRSRIASTDLRQLGIADPIDDSADGYLPEIELDSMIRSLGLRASPGGVVVLRTTTFDFARVRALAGTRVVAALDAATSVDPRIRGVGRRALVDLLEGYR